MAPAVATSSCACLTAAARLVSLFGERFWDGDGGGGTSFSFSPSTSNFNSGDVLPHSGLFEHRCGAMGIVSGTEAPLEAAGGQGAAVVALGIPVGHLHDTHAR